MTLPSYPTQFLAHCKAYKADKKPTLQRAKNANAQPTRPADEYLYTSTINLYLTPKPTHHPSDSYKTYNLLILSILISH